MSRLIKVIVFLLVFTSNGYAALNDVGDGIIESTDQNLQWMKDANVFKTLCDSGNAIATEFTPIVAKDAASICDNDGAMTWYDAEAWLLRLNSFAYLGYSDWRQPTLVQPDTSCSGITEVAANGNPDQWAGYQCIGGELGYLYTVVLGNSDHLSTNCGSCLTNRGPFIGLRDDYYWTGTTFVTYPKYAWYFYMHFGTQSDRGKDFRTNFVWPVRNKDTKNAIAVSSDIEISLGLPQQNMDVSGTATINGWAVSPDGISKVELYINGDYVTDIPFGEERKDVNNKFPAFPDSLNSGFSMRYLFSRLDDDTHYVSVRAYDLSGRYSVITKAVNTSSYAVGWAANNEVDLSTIVLDYASADSIILRHVDFKGIEHEVLLKWDQTIQNIAATKTNPIGGLFAGNAPRLKGKYKLARVSFQNHLLGFADTKLGGFSASGTMNLTENTFIRSLVFEGDDNEVLEVEDISGTFVDREAFVTFDPDEADVPNRSFVVVALGDLLILSNASEDEENGGVVNMIEYWKKTESASPLVNDDY